jgi:hypothetical protein
MYMVERDAIEAFDEAIKRLDTTEGAAKEALKDAQEAARRARKKGYPIAALAKRAHRHRNTITEWCKD